MAKELKVHGLMNVQFAVQNETVYVLEVNPRASRGRRRLSESDRRPVAQTRGENHGGENACGTGLHQGDRAGALLREGSGLPIYPLSRHRYRARAGDEVDGRSDGYRCGPWPRVCKGADGHTTARCRKRGTFSSASPIVKNRAWRNWRGALSSRASPFMPPAEPRRPQRCRDSGDQTFQAERRPAQCARYDQERRAGDDHQHAEPARRRGRTR